MREVSVLMFVTADGVMQAPQPEAAALGDPDRGGWAVPLWDEVMEQVGREAMADPFDLLLGRNTYDLFASSHPSDGGEENPMNRATKYVVTSRADELPWTETVVLGGDVVASVERLKAGDGPLLQIHGSHRLVQTLLAAGLVDCLRLWTFPVVVGTGKRLFDGGAAPGRLRLLKSEATANGAVMALYRRS